MEAADRRRPQASSSSVATRLYQPGIVTSARVVC
jgi:hypothetical protein